MAVKRVRSVGPVLLAVSLLALVVTSAGGSSTAASGCPGGAAHCPTFNGTDIIDGTLTGKDVKNHSLTSKDFSGSIRGQRGPAGQQGPPGAQGQTGATGPQGAQGQQGNPGTNGTNGSPGATGATGPSGATGPAGSARAYAQVDPGLTPSLVTARTKNFTAVAHSAFTGTYCLTAAAGITPGTVAAVASEEWSTSTDHGLAIPRSDGAECPAGQFEVITVKLDGTFVNTIGFDLLVP